MKVLFVASGNSGKAGVLVNDQAESLKRQGVGIELFLIKGKGFRGYLKNIRPIREHLKNNKYDVVHAHYSFSGFAASLAHAKPLVVSLMGSDLQAHWLHKMAINIFCKLYRWDRIIVKSEKMKRRSGLRSAAVIPNGVDTELFKELNKKDCIKKLGWDESMKNVLFAADPTRSEKNFLLAQNAIKILNDQNIVLHTLGKIPHHEMPVWFNASDVVILSSLYEGSPNVIKEAMSCNRPIVCTDVGDIRWLFGEEPGHFISNFSYDDFAMHFKNALQFSVEHEGTRGRKLIIDLGLDSVTVAKKIIDIYQGVKAKK